MLSLFRINDPYRLVFLLVLLCALRIPVFIIGQPATAIELHWLVLGEKLTTPGTTLYLDVWDSTGPLAAGVYYWVYLLFGKSFLAMRLLGLLLVLVQAVIFNSILIKNKAHVENTYIPAFFYVLFSQLVFDTSTLSPVLMGLTFLLFAINYIFKRIDNFTRDSLFLYSGLHLGLATLFYLPYFIFFLIFVLSVLLYTSAIPRRVLLLVHGYFLVIIIAASYFYLFGAQQFFWKFWLASWWIIGTENLLGWKGFGVLILPLLFFSIIAIFQTFSKGKYVNYQFKFQQVFVLLFFGGLINLLVADRLLPYQAVLFVPIVAFFMSHYMLSLRKRWLTEVISLSIVSLVVVFSLSLFNQWFYPTHYVALEKTHVAEIAQDLSLFEGQNVVVLGQNQAIYQHGKMVTPYLHWPLTMAFHKPFDTFEGLADFHLHLSNGTPSLIVDEEGLFEALAPKLPLLQRQYTPLSGSESIFVRKGRE